LLEGEARFLRPLNYPPGTVGQGSGVFGGGKCPAFAVFNAQGRTFMPDLDNPFAVLPPEIDRLRGQTKIILLDFHAEATSEKIAIARMLDGRVSAVVGTHTHVQTADEKRLPKGTAYLTDLGMTGGLGGIIGMKWEISVERQLTLTRGERMQPSDEDLHLQGAVVEIDDATGLSKSIERVSVGLERVLTERFGKKHG